MLKNYALKLWEEVKSFGICACFCEYTEYDGDDDQGRMRRYFSANTHLSQ